MVRHIDWCIRIDSYRINIWYEFSDSDYIFFTFYGVSIWTGLVSNENL